MNAIYLRRRSKIVVPEGRGEASRESLATLQRNITSLGFVLADDALESVGKLDEKQLAEFYGALVSDLRVLVGAHRVYAPRYPNFPEQVMAASEAELYLDAVAYYVTGRREEYARDPRPELRELGLCRVVRLGDRADFENVFTLLAKSKSPFSATDRDDVKWFVKNLRENVVRLLPDDMPCKENAAVVTAELLRELGDAEALADRYVKTATDALRVAVALSGGDVSLAEPCRPFGKFSRRERRAILGWIERAPNRVEDMLRWKPRWIRLGERLHPGEHAARFPRVAEAFDVLRNDRPFQSFNGRVETALAAGDVGAAIATLAARPGELARRLDHLARSTSEPRSVVEAFALRAGEVSTPVLLQAMTHFRRRASADGWRVFFPKGQVANLYAVEKPLPPIADEVAHELATICERTLVARFATLPRLGRCYVDPRLRKFLVPFSQRSAGKSLRTLVRGSRLPLPEGEVLRFFVWWKNGATRTDVDLSAAVFAPDFSHVETLSYYNLRGYGGCHSGDVTDAPDGASEFIDVNLESCREAGVRYVVMCLNSYTRQPYCDLPECFAGWMCREDAAAGEVFEPKTVADKVDVASDSQACVPAVFDLVENEVLWADVAFKSHPLYANNVANNSRGISLVLRALTRLRKTDLHTLFELHARARGELVATPAEADAVFAVDRGVTPFDLDRIAAEFL